MNSPAFCDRRQSEFEFSAKMTFKADNAEAGVALASWVATT